VRNTVDRGEKAIYLRKEKYFRQLIDQDFRLALNDFRGLAAESQYLVKQRKQN